MPSPGITVLIHVVGLSVLSSQIPNETGLKMILPRVVYFDPSGPALESHISIANMGGVTAPLRITQHRHVEDHAAILAFKTADRDPSSNWGPVNELKNTGKMYSYIRLNGERVQFDLGYSAAPGAFPSGGVRLPKLPDLCNATQRLKAAYLPPFYSGVAALFDIPAGGVNACLASSQNRVDSEITLLANADLVVYTGSGRARRQLRLKPTTGRIELIVGNVPVSCLNGQCVPPPAAAMNGITHEHAYFDMGAGDTSTCGTSIRDWFYSRPPAQRPGNCVMGTIPDAAGGNGMLEVEAPDGGVHKSVVYNFECSNSQWP